MAEGQNQSITSLVDMRARQEQLFPEGVKPELNDVAYVTHGTGSET